MGAPAMRDALPLLSLPGLHPCYRRHPSPPVVAARCRRRWQSGRFPAASSWRATA